MSHLDGRRTSRGTLVAVLLFVCAVIAGCITACSVSRDDSPDFCRELSKDSRVQYLLATAHRAETNCATMGDALKKAVTREEGGKHSVKQAQAMKGALLAIDDQMKKSDISSLDEELSVPVADALADYSDDVYGILAPGNFDYSQHDSPSDQPWANEAGAHVSIPQKSLMRVIRGVSATPPAYAELRMGVTRSAVRELVSTPESAIKAADYSGPEGPSAPKVNAWALAAMDAIAGNVTTDLKKERAAGWQKSVFVRLTQDVPGSVPSYETDPDRNILVAWQEILKSTDNSDLVMQLQGQGPVLVKAWGEGIKLSEKEASSLADDARFSAESARGTWAQGLG